MQKTFLFIIMTSFLLSCTNWTSNVFTSRKPAGVINSCFTHAAEFWNHDLSFRRQKKIDLHFKNEFADLRGKPNYLRAHELHDFVQPENRAENIVNQLFEFAVLMKTQDKKNMDETLQKLNDWVKSEGHAEYAYEWFQQFYLRDSRQYINYLVTNNRYFLALNRVPEPPSLKKRIIVLKAEITDYFLSVAEKTVSFFNRRVRHGKVLTPKYARAAEKVSFKVKKKIGAGFFGVIYKVEIEDFGSQAIKKYPHLFVDGKPRKDLIIKFAQRFRVSKALKALKVDIWDNALKAEKEETMSFLKALEEKGMGMIHGSEILFEEPAGDLPFLIKPLVTGSDVKALSKDQLKLTDIQLKRLKADIFEKAVKLYEFTGVHLDLKVENLVWDPVKEKWFMYELTQTLGNNSTFVANGFDGYVNMVTVALKRYGAQ